MISIQRLLRAFATKFLAIACGFISVSVIARYATTEQAGKYFLQISLLLTLSSALYGWMQIVAIRAYTGVAEKRARIRVTNDVARFAGRNILLLTGTLFIAGLIILPNLSIETSFARAILKPIDLAFVVLGAGVVGLNTTSMGICRGLGFVEYPLYGDNVLKPVVLIITQLAALKWCSGQLSSDTLAIAYTLALLCLLSYLTPKVLSNTRPQSKIDSTPNSSELYASWWKLAPTLIAATAVSTLANQSDLLLLGHLATTTEIAIYKVGAQLAALCSIGVAIANFIYAPHIAAAYAGSDFHGLYRLAAKSSAVTTLAALFVATALFFSAPLFLTSAYKSEYSQSYTILVVLLIGRVIDAFFGPLSNIAALTGLQRYIVYSVSLSLPINLSVGILLWDTHNILGVAFGACIGMVTWNVLLAIFLNNKIRSIRRESHSTPPQ